jgi:hypothetical protein
MGNKKARRDLKVTAGSCAVGGDAYVLRLRKLFCCTPIF